MITLAEPREHDVVLGGGSPNNVELEQGRAGEAQHARQRAQRVPGLALGALAALAGLSAGRDRAARRRCRVRTTQEPQRPARMTRPRGQTLLSRGVGAAGRESLGRCSLRAWREQHPSPQAARVSLVGMKRSSGGTPSTRRSGAAHSHDGSTPREPRSIRRSLSAWTNAAGPVCQRERLRPPCAPYMPTPHRVPQRVPNSPKSTAETGTNGPQPWFSRAKETPSLAPHNPSDGGSNPPPPIRCRAKRRARGGGESRKLPGT
jgi:hypothetical protein